MGELYRRVDANLFATLGCRCGGVLEVRDGHSSEGRNIVIPAKAGIHWLFDGSQMNPRLRGDDDSLFDERR
jgi:hypothetical protein